MGDSRWDMKTPHIENVIRQLNLREPFSARCVQRAIPGLRKEEVAAHLRKHALTNDRRQQPEYIRVFRGWYRLNQDRTRLKSG
jgi:hypothetical protein